MTILVVTGTGTGVGKTVVTAAIAALAMAAGRRVAVVKPVQTGAAPTEPADLAEVDRLAAPTTLLELARYPDPLAPAAAARLAGLPFVDLTRFADRIQLLTADHELVLVEGAGGRVLSVQPVRQTLEDYFVTEMGAAGQRQGADSWGEG